MTQWPAPLELAQAKLGFLDQLHYIFSRALPAGVQLDAISSATPLDYLKTQLKLQHSVAEIGQAPVFGILGGKGGELVVGAYLLGGLYLLQQRIVSWHVPTVFLLVLAAMSGVFHLVDPAQYAGPAFHLFSGASMMCAFFIATDPVSGRRRRRASSSLPPVSAC